MNPLVDSICFGIIVAILFGLVYTIMIFGTAF